MGRNCLPVVPVPLPRLAPGERWDTLLTSFIIFWNDFRFLLLWFSNPNIYLFTSTLFFLCSKSSALIRNKHFYSFLILKNHFSNKYLLYSYFQKKIDYYFCYVICTSTNWLYIPHCITEYVVRRSYNLYILSLYATYQYLHGIVIVVLI